MKLLKRSFCLASLAACSAVSYGQYAATRLPGFSGPNSFGTVATSVNDVGTITGTGKVTLTVAYYAFRSDRGTNIVNLGTNGEPYVYSHGLGINDSDVIAGQIGSDAVLWGPTNAVTQLPRLPNTNASGAQAINGLGVAVGFCNEYSGVQDGTVWMASGPVNTGSLGGRTTVATAINDANAVAGYSTTATGTTSAFTWTEALGIAALQGLGGGYDAATGINGSGWVVGSSKAIDGTTHAVVWETTLHQFVDLGTGTANAINASNEVVGATAGGQAFVWSPSQGKRLLAPLAGGGIQLATANGISDSGYIVAVSPAYGQQGAGLSYLLTPQAVPEPSGLAAMGLGGLAVLRRRRR